VAPKRAFFAEERGNNMFGSQGSNYSTMQSTIQRDKAFPNGLRSCHGRENTQKMGFC
jgi:hypothetical protein